MGPRATPGEWTATAAHEDLAMMRRFKQSCIYSLVRRT
jgi:hypothetical protein